jgi:hypothetical protein
LLAANNARPEVIRDGDMASRSIAARMSVPLPYDQVGTEKRIGRSPIASGNEAKHFGGMRPVNADRPDSPLMQDACLQKISSKFADTQTEHHEFGPRFANCDRLILAIVADNVLAFFEKIWYMPFSIASFFGGVDQCEATAQWNTNTHQQSVALAESIITGIDAVG